MQSSAVCSGHRSSRSASSTCALPTSTRSLPPRASRAMGSRARQTAPTGEVRRLQLIYHCQASILFASPGVNEMLAFVLSRLFTHTLLSGILGAILGAAIGVVAGALRRSISGASAVSIRGAFVGCLLACISPLICTPGSLESWGTAGGLGSLSVLVSLALIALGGLIGGLAASTFGYRWVMTMKPRLFAWIMSGIYILMAGSLAHGYLRYCFAGSSYC